jgi:poly-gamma-glutamate synthesis protein (capsule biosynthesis protein)
MIRVAAVGDLMLGDSSNTVGFGVHSRYAGRRIGEVFEELAPRLRGADLGIGNLECPLAESGVGRTEWAQNQMRGDAAYAGALREAGFTAISVANNHAMQHGDAGFAATVTALRDAEILVLGLRGSGPWQAAPAIYRHPDGASIALLAYSWRPRQYGSGTPPYAEVDEVAVLADVARARAAHDGVIVSLHWGVEFVDQPSAHDVRFAHALADQGADLVLGHHPHVVRPVERHGTTVIAYSLGNCVCDMLWQEPLRRGILLEADLVPATSNVRLTGIRVDDRYHARLERAPIHQLRADPPPGLQTAEYEARAASGLRRQRLAAYLYAARNLLRFPPSVLSTLFVTTATNKWRSVRARLSGSLS